MANVKIVSINSDLTQSVGENGDVRVSGASTVSINSDLTQSVGLTTPLTQSSQKRFPLIPI